MLAHHLLIFSLLATCAYTFVIDNKSPVQDSSPQ